MMNWMFQCSVIRQWWNSYCLFKSLWVIMLFLRINHLPFQMEDIDLKIWKTVEDDGKCLLKYREDTFIPIDGDGITVAFDGFLTTDIIIKALKPIYKGHQDVGNLSVIRNNLNATIANPLSKVRCLCAREFFPTSTKCQRKVRFCQSSIMQLEFLKITYLSEFDSWSKTLLMNLETKQISNCRIPERHSITFSNDYQTFICLFHGFGADVLSQCEIGVECRKKAYRWM